MLFYNFLKKYGYGLNFKDVIVITYGGIRGAICISFSLIISSDPFFEEKFKHILIMHISCCSFLTLISFNILLKLMPQLLDF